MIQLFERCINSENSSWKKDAFSDAQSMATKILTLIEAEDYEEAIYLWKLLEHYSDESLPITEEFLSNYMPIRQSVINFGLQ